MVERMRNAYGFPVRDYGVSAGPKAAGQRPGSMELGHPDAGVSYPGAAGLTESLRATCSSLGAVLGREKRVPRRVSPLPR